MVLVHFKKEILQKYVFNSTVRFFNIFLFCLKGYSETLKARETCVVQSHTPVEDKNGFVFSSPFRTPYTDSFLVSWQSSFYRENKKF